MDAVRCPGCGEAMARVVEGGVRYTCGRCRGHVVGLAPFTHEHADGRHLWVASAEAPEAGSCPICGGAMRAPAGAPDGLLICRRCEQVWVPAGAEAGLSPAAGPATGDAAAAPRAASHPDECPECGAPWAPDPAGRCRYCREQLSSGEQPLVIIERPAARFGGGALGIAVGIAEGLVEGSSW